MNKPLHQFFTEDHHRIDDLLNKAIEQPNEIDMDYYHQFRTQLLRHIKMEENTLFPAAKKVDPAVMQALIPRYRLEHGALTALMVPPPTSSLIKVIRYVLEKHDRAEEKPGGLYDVCEALTHGQTQELFIGSRALEKASQDLFDLDGFRQVVNRVLSRDGPLEQRLSTRRHTL